MDDVASGERGSQISGWTTDADNYLRVFTPVTASEVGVSQRHTGVAGTGFRLVQVRNDLLFGESTLPHDASWF